MKKLLCLALALFLMLGLCGCQFIAKEIIERDVTSADDAALYKHGLELAEVLDEMLSNDQYLQLISDSGEINAVLEPYIRTDFSEPESVYRITPSEDLISILTDMGEIDLDGFSESLRKFWERRALNYVPNMLNAQSSSTVLAASSLFTFSDTWVGETLEEDCYLLYFYPDSCPVIATFYGGDGYIEGSAALLLGENVTDDSLDEVENIFSELGAENMQVEKLDINSN